MNPLKDFINFLRLIFSLQHPLHSAASLKECTFSRVINKNSEQEAFMYLKVSRSYSWRTCELLVTKLLQQISACLFCLFLSFRRMQKIHSPFFLCRFNEPGMTAFHLTQHLVRSKLYHKFYYHLLLLHNHSYRHVHNLLDTKRRDSQKNPQNYLFIVNPPTPHNNSEHTT